MTTNQVSVGTNATLIVAANFARDHVVIISKDNDFYIGGPGVTAGTGHYVPAKAPLPLSERGAVYGIVASGTAAVTFCDQALTDI